MVGQKGLTDFAFTSAPASSTLQIDISGSPQLATVTISGGAIQGLDARGCTRLKKIEGDIKVLDVSNSGLDITDASFDCARTGSQILFAQNLKAKLSPASALDLISKCLWSSVSERKLLDLAGAWHGGLPKNQLQHVLQKHYMKLFDTVPFQNMYAMRTLELGQDGSVQCRQDPKRVKDSDLPRYKNGDTVGQDVAVMQFQCGCVANHYHDKDDDLCKENVPFLAQPGGIATMVMSTVVALLLALAIQRVVRRRFFRLRDNLDLTERLLGKAQDDVLALRKAWELPAEDVHLLKRIDGSSPGAFGEVWQADWDGIAVAVKVLRLSMMELDHSTQEEFDKEAEFLMRARHSNVVRFFGAGVQASGAPFLVLELVPRGSLRSLLRSGEDEEEDEKEEDAHGAAQRTHPLSAEAQLQLALDVARGMEYIHGLGALHRDLKSGNVLVTEAWRGKVADFGSMGNILSGLGAEGKRGGSTAASVTSSTHFGGSESVSMTLTRGVGTPLYMSPEVLRGEKYGQGADVWR